jgi:hypothetical protein
MGFTMTQIGNNKLLQLNISGSYFKSNPSPSMDPEENIRQSKLTYPYQHDFNIKEEDAVMFCFGEIDCRLVFAATGYSETWQQMVDKSVSEYFESIKMNVENFNHLHTMVYNIIPAFKHKDLPTYPKEGTDEHRKTIVQYVNKRFKEYCEKYGYIYFDIYDKHCDEDGYMIYNLTDGSNHVFNPVYHHEFLKNLKF